MWWHKKKLVFKSQENKRGREEKGPTKKIQKKKKIKKMAIGTYISTISLNVNGLNAAIKRHRLAVWIKKKDSYISCLM